MELTYLQEFTIFSEYMNVSEAARHLYLSKSALSKHLSSLEQEMGAQLFTRGGKLELTPAGYLLRDHCVYVLDAYSRALAAVSKAPEQCRYGFSEIDGLDFAPEVVGMMREAS